MEAFSNPITNAIRQQSALKAQDFWDMLNPIFSDLSGFSISCFTDTTSAHVRLDVYIGENEKQTYSCLVER